MNQYARVSIISLRLALGWFMFFAGIEKVLNPEWTAANFLRNAKTFPEFYVWFAEPMNSWWVDPLNAWGITLIGVGLLLGVFVRPAALFGAFLMILYYFPHVTFPMVPRGFIVEEHIVYAIAFLVVMFLPEASQWGLGKVIKRTKFQKLPVLGKYI